MGNTVDALKKLYKNLVGEDWPYGPNPTDAEVIEKIAEDHDSNEGQFPPIPPVPGTTE